MRRCNSLIKAILVYVETKCVPGEVNPLPDISGHDAREVAYHVRLCEQAGHLTLGGSENFASVSGSGFYIKELTWKGHEALTSLRQLCN